MAGELKLPSFFGPNMVLQRNQPLKIWGWAAPGASVEVRFSVRNASVTADAEGRWSAEMESLPAGGPFDLSVKSGDEEKRLSNVLVGDVWICSGQSNMEWTIDALAASHRPKDFPNLPHVRLFTVSHDAAASPKTNVSGVWGVASEKTIRSFSAVGFFFGRQLNETLGVPIGLIATSWGGTAAEAWTPAHAMAKHPDLSYVVEHLQAEAPASEPHEDPGNIGLGAGWAAPDFDDADWPEMALPTYWEDAGLDMDGSVWFRREIDVPLDWSQQDLMLSLGAIDDFDHTYFNGYEIGRTGLETTGWWGVQREYVVPRRLIRAGRNVIAVRVFDRWGQGGFAGPREKMWLAPVNDQSAIMPLTGDWPYKIEHKLTTVNLANAVPPTSLYNGMIHPLAGLPISGFTWYQGESNTGRAHLYQTLLATMIRSWRNAWGQGDLPFLIVQLAGFSQPDDHGASSWAELREAQRLVSLSEPRCGLACTIDIGEPDDIHPSNKLDVGLRLAMEALHVAYGHDDVERSPTYRSHAVHGHEVKVQFERGDTLEPIDSVSGFSLAGEDQKFYPAEARVEGNAVVVRSEAVTTPVAVRYGWRGFPDCNLRTRSGLPVLPFRSDDWPWTTQGAR